MSDLHIGFSRKKDGRPIEIPLKSLKRHFAALGSSGSGKTVLVKAIMEEAIRAGIPLLLVDLQGDLASLALNGNIDTVISKGVPREYYDEINSKKQVAIFTPASSKGIAISMNPLKSPPEGMDEEDRIQAVDSVADTVANILGYNTEKGKGAEVKSYLFLLLRALWDENINVERFDVLAKYIADDSDILDETSRSMINDKLRQQLAKEVKMLTIGTDSLIFNMGVPLDVERLMKWADPGKVPVNVLYLNTLRKQEDKINFIADVATQVYNFMLKNPSDDIQLIFVLDELAGLVPPIRNPPSKKSIQLLLKQARKYGVSLLLATQNISDVDYKSLGQVGTWALGRLMAKQDIEKVKDIIQSISPTETDTILSTLTKQTVGQFMLLAPDVYKEVQPMQVRWLVTEHTTLDDVAVKKYTDESGLRDKFPDAKTKRKSARKTRKKEPKVIDEEEPDLEEEDYEEELTNKEAESLSISKAKTPEQITRMLDSYPYAISADDLARVNNTTPKQMKSKLDSLVKSKKVKSAKVEDQKLYWSSKHEMDVENNIIGPIFRVDLEVTEGEAYKLMEKHLKTVLKVKKIEKIVDKYTQLKYLPLWKIGVIIEKKYGFLKKKTKEINKFFYVNGMTGGILHFDEDEDMISYPFSISEPDKIITFGPEDIDTQLISLDMLGKNDLKPLLSRKHAIDQITRKLGHKINYKVVPSIVYYPYWEFVIKDKDTKKEREAWIDGVYGFYTEINPLEDTEE